MIFSRRRAPPTPAELYTRDCARMGLRAEWLGGCFSTGRGRVFVIAGLTLDGRVLLRSQSGPGLARAAPDTVRAWMTAD